MSQYQFRVKRRPFEDGKGRKFTVGEVIQEKDLEDCHPRNIKAMISLGWLEKIEIKIVSAEEKLAEVDKDEETRKETTKTKPKEKTPPKSAKAKKRNKPGRPPKKKIAG